MLVSRDPNTVRRLTPDHPYGSTRWLPRMVSRLGLRAGLTLALAGVASASLDPDKPISDFIHQSWQTAQGLPQNSVLSLAQTSDGYIWMGTEEGLVRFDGVRFTVFDQHKFGLANNTVMALLADHHQNLWIGTAGGGLSRFHDGTFTPFAMHTGLAGSSVRSLYEDGRGAIWIGTDGGGLIRFQDGKFRIFTTADGLADNSVLSIASGRDGSLWIATHGGLDTFSDGRFLRFRVNGKSSCESARVAHVDRSGALWLGTLDGLCRVSSNGVRRFTVKDGLTNNVVYSLFEDSAGTLWIGTANGLTRFANGAFSSFSEREGLLGKEVWAIYEDHEGSLWVGTAGGGINLFKKGLFTTLTKSKGLPSDTVLPVYQDRQGTVWIGSDQGLTAWNDGRLTNYTRGKGVPDNLVFSIAQDHSGTLWIGTRHGLTRLKDGKIGPIEDLAGNRVVCTYVDHKNGLWAGSRSGLTHFDGHSFNTYTTRDGLPSDDVRAIYEDGRGTLWIGTSGGLSRLEDGRFTSYTTKNGLASNVVWTIAGETDGTLWLGTNGGGLSRLRDGKITTFTSTQGLYDNSVLGLIDDQLGDIWMTCDKGVFKVSKKQLNDFASGLTSRITPTVYGTADGMKSQECDGAFQPSVWRLQDGRLCFPTTKGLAIIQPAHLVKNLTPPVLEDVLINNKEFPANRPATVPPGKGQLELTFTAPSFIDPGKIQFRYMLDGFDKDWTDAGGRRTAYYTNIPHGQYRFKVQAGTGGEWSTTGPELAITLQPHYYETLSFFIGIALGFLGLGIGIYAIRVNQLKVRELKLLQLVDERTAALQESERQLRASRDQLEVRVEERTQELVESNRALEGEVAVRRRTEGQLTLAKEAAEAASRAKSDFLANMSHEIRTPINGIIGMTELTLTTDLGAEQQEYLEIVKSSADTLLRIVNDILDFSKIEASKLTLEKIPFELRDSIHQIIRSLSLRATQKNLKLSIQIHSAVPNDLIGDPLRLRQVLLNLLDNAIKFTSKGSITLTVTPQPHSGDAAVLHFAVKDTGIGVPIAKQRTIFESFSQADTSSTRKYGGTGLGLAISSQLVEMMDGMLSVDSQPGQGSTFRFTARFERVPKPKRHALEAPSESAVPVEILA